MLSAINAGFAVRAGGTLPKQNVSQSQNTTAPTTLFQNHPDIDGKKNPLQNCDEKVKVEDVRVARVIAQKFTYKHGDAELADCEYSGTIINDKLNADQGTMVFKLGNGYKALYQGSFRNDLLHGKGVLKLDRYEGHKLQLLSEKDFNDKKDKEDGELNIDQATKKLSAYRKKENKIETYEASANIDYLITDISNNKLIVPDRLINSFKNYTDCEEGGNTTKIIKINGIWKDGKIVSRLFDTAYANNSTESWDNILKSVISTSASSKINNKQQSAEAGSEISSKIEYNNKAKVKNKALANGGNVEKQLASLLTEISTELAKGNDNKASVGITTLLNNWFIMEDHKFKCDSNPPTTFLEHEKPKCGIDPQHLYNHYR